MERVLHLDGQILQLGTATVGYWKMQDPQSPVLLNAVVSNRVVTLNVLKFEAAAESGKQNR